MSTAIIDLNTELLVDLSCIELPELRLLLRVIGWPVAPGSAWVAIPKVPAVSDLQPRAMLPVDRQYATTGKSFIN